MLVLTGHTLKDADYTIDFHRGTLLTDEEKSGSEAEIEALRRDAVTVDATPEAVLAAIEGQSGMSGQTIDREASVASCETLSWGPRGFDCACPRLRRILDRGLTQLPWRWIFISRLRLRRRRSSQLPPPGAMRIAVRGSKTT